MLERAGYAVIEAPDGQTALRIAETRGRATIHLLLTDVVMPGMDGLDLADRFRQRRAETKVLFASGHAYETEELVTCARRSTATSGSRSRPTTPSRGGWCAEVVRWLTRARRA